MLTVVCSSSWQTCCPCLFDITINHKTLQSRSFSAAVICDATQSTCSHIGSCWLSCQWVEAFVKPAGTIQFLWPHESVCFFKCFPHPHYVRELTTVFCLWKEQMSLVELRHAQSLQPPYSFERKCAGFLPLFLLCLCCFVWDGKCRGALCSHH